MALIKRVIEKRLRRDISISKNQFSFISSRLTVKAIHVIRRLMELYRDKKKELHGVFIDLEKLDDRVSHEVLLECLEKKGVSVAYIWAIKDMYKRVETSAWISTGDTKKFL